MPIASLSSSFSSLEHNANNFPVCAHNFFDVPSYCFLWPCYKFLSPIFWVIKFELVEFYRIFQNLTQSCRILTFLGYRDALMNILIEPIFSMKYFCTYKCTCQNSDVWDKFKYFSNHIAVYNFLKNELSQIFWQHQQEFAAATCGLTFNFQKHIGLFI